MRDASEPCASTTMKDVTIVIEQLQPSYLRGDRQVWEVKVWIFDDTSTGSGRFGWTTSISDPFDQTTHDKVAQYLNELLSSPNPAVHVDLIAKVPREIEKYQRFLKDSLNLETCSEMNDAEKLSQRPIKIEILTKASFIKDSTEASSSLQYLHWELLESEGLLSQTQITRFGTFLRPVSVRIRRQIEEGTRVPGRDTRNRLNDRVDSASHQNAFAGTFQVLVVVARDLSKNPDPWSPTVIPAALLRVQEEYLVQGLQQQIVIKVARPGSLQRFKEILETGTFNVVHFDMHGGRSTSEQGAQLQFNVHNELGEEWINGKDVAQTIQTVGKSNVSCVIIGACQSARADASAYANLAATFVGAGVSNVLAMSYKMGDTMSQKFFDKFYSELFVGCQEFSEAARLARSQLVQDRSRTHYKARLSVEITDWFVPVVYSNGTRFFVDNFGTPRGALGLARPFNFTRRGLMLGVIAISGIGSMWLLYRYVHHWTLFMASAAFAVFLHKTHQWWLNTELENRNSFYEALQASTNDRDNIIRLEHNLHRARSVFFNSILENHSHKKKARQFLRNLVKIWERTHLVDGVVMLDSDCFLKSTSWRRLYGEWRIRIWRLTKSQRRDYEPHLIVIIEDVHRLYNDELDAEQFDGKINLETWVKSSFGTDPSASNPYLIMVGRAPVKENVDTSTESTLEWIETNFKPIKALQNMAATVFHTTDCLSANRAERSRFPATTPTSRVPRSYSIRQVSDYGS